MGDKEVEALGSGAKNNNSDAFEDYNGIEAARRRTNNDVTVGGAEILDNSGKLDEQFKLQTKTKPNDKNAANRMPRKILANSGQYPNIKEKSHQICETIVSGHRSKSMLKRTQRSNILMAASAGSLNLQALQDPHMGTVSSRMCTEDGAFNLFTHQRRRQLEGASAL